MGAFELVVNAFTIIIVFSIPFALFAYTRYLRYKETIALAERGLLRPQRTRRNRDTLRWGIIIMMIGLGLLCGLWPLGFMASGSDFAAVPEISDTGQSPVADGGSAIPGVPEISDTGQAPVMIGESGAGGLPFGLGPWMALGILPFFFGLALILIYFVNKREGVEEGDNGAIPAHKQVDSGEV
jgi:hypothetical protein